MLSCHLKAISKVFHELLVLPKPAHNALIVRVESLNLGHVLWEIALIVSLNSIRKVAA